MIGLDVFVYYGMKTYFLMILRKVSVAYRMNVENSIAHPMASVIVHHDASSTE